MAAPAPTQRGELNAGQELLRRAAARGDAALFHCEGRTTRGDELVARAEAFHAALARREIAAGERVLLLLRDTPEFAAAFLGALRAGAIPVPLSTFLSPAELAFVAQDAEARLVVLDGALPGAAELAAALPAGVRCERIEAGRGLDPGPGAAPAPARTRAADPAFWLYTSGTTGEPKGVLHRHGDLLATAEAYARGVLGLGPGDRGLSASKLFFAFGLGNSLGFPLALGFEAVLHPGRPTPEAIFALFERHAPSVFFGVPTLYAALLAHPALPRRLPGLRLCVSAGERLPPGLLARWQDRFGVEILDGLGSTEMLHVFLSPRPGAVVPGSCGRPVPGYAVRVVDAEGSEVAPGEVGTLLVRGPSASPGYWRRPERTAETMLASGWIRSGDSVRREPDGSYTHLGRTDELLKVGGIYVAPAEVEAVLLEHPQVMEAAVVGHADPQGLVKPHAFVVPRPGAAPGPELGAELLAFARSRLAPFKVPRGLTLRDTLPRTATGKLQRHRLQAELA